MVDNWTTESMPDLTGKTAIVTGANSGLGYETALALAAKGARVIVASRDASKGQVAVKQIEATRPKGSVIFMPLDLADLTAIRQFATQFAGQFKSLDLLINNAGVMHLPYRTTADGFEMQFGTNHLGHFALTGLLLPVLLRTSKARVVTVSSGLHRSGHINFDDLNAKSNYSEFRAYSQSKLANLLFTYELQRQFEAHQSDVIAVAAHPGYSATNLQFGAARMYGSVLRERVMQVANSLFAQSAAMGALPTLFAAVSPTVHGGDYIGPKGFQEMRGYPAVVKSNAESYDVNVARRLWLVSEQLTGVQYEPLFQQQLAAAHA
ncbi:MAG: SDR family NAD(P)-dependent oxidoreductase [Anaerolineaceae bacterium]|nr:SDR family NAD(P)-dependent oxidoreductase [Anaerolineaceae bacterium]